MCTQVRVCTSDPALPEGVAIRWKGERCVFACVAGLEADAVHAREVHLCRLPDGIPSRHGGRVAAPSLRVPQLLAF